MLRSALLTTVLASLAGPARPAAAAVPLAAGASDTGAMQALDVRAYAVEIPENGYLQAALQQQGVDLELELVDPAGRVVGRRDVHAHRLRAERLSYVSPEGGTHLLQVRAHPGEPAGRFVVRIEKLQPATAHDRLQAAADLANGGARAAPAQERRAAEQAAQAALSALVAEFRALDPPRPSVVAVGLYHLGLLEVKTGDAAGEGRLRESLALAGEEGDEYTQMLALTALGDAHVPAGRLEDALAAYGQALELAEAVDDGVARAYYVAKSALVLSGLGRYEQAGAAFARARDLYRALGNHAEEVRTVNNTASALRMLGDYPRALEAAQEALALARAAGLRELEAGLLVNVARLHGLLGAPVPARARYQEALAIAQALRAVEDTAASADGLATLALAEQDFERARRLALAGLAAWSSIGNSLGAAHSSDLAGQALHGQAGGDAGRLQEAHDRLQWALDARRRFRHRSGQAETLVHMARLERDRGRLEQALAHARAAVELADGLRGDIDHPDFRAAFAASHQETYDLYVELQMEMRRVRPDGGHDAEAFSASERARARVLLEALAAARADIRAGGDGALGARERAAQQRLQAAGQRLARTDGGREVEVDRHQAEYEAAAEELRRVQAEVRRQDPRYAALMQPDAAGLDALRRDALDEETVLIAFHLGARRSFAWALTRTALVSTELPPRAVIEEAARRLHASMTARQGTTAPAALRRADQELSRRAGQLGALLLGGLAGPLAKEWAGRRLLLVVPGALAYVPFAALPFPAGSAQPLMASHEIVYAPSASVLAALRRQHAGPAPRSGARIAVLADPVFEPLDPRVKGSGAPPAPPPPAALRAAQALGRTGFTRLPFSRREAEAIAAASAPDQVLKATDFQATRALVAGGGLGDRRIVHFATHGVLHTDRPDLSGLVLSLVDEKGAAQDGFLRMPDVYNLRLPADLVVLSGCQTALGRELRGEGLVGLTRGFLYAGARAVVASLWQVDDESTAELMRRFYRGILQENRRPPDALRRAQAEMSADRRWSAPFYWAGFVLQGDWR